MVHNPTYHYDPHFAFKGVKTSAPSPLLPALTIRWGLYGSICRSKATAFTARARQNREDLLCIRLTNWDVEDLASRVQKGTKVTFKGAMAHAIDKPK